ncbi:MAG: hypothetical protein JNN27_00775 [Planctomycetes bacterium]|nr:hypothetical protein [Planctomycetota bacterium]
MKRRARSTKAKRATETVPKERGTTRSRSPKFASDSLPDVQSSRTPVLVVASRLEAFGAAAEAWREWARRQKNLSSTGAWIDELNDSLNAISRGCSPSILAPHMSWRLIDAIGDFLRHARFAAQLRGISTTKREVAALSSRLRKLAAAHPTAPTEDGPAQALNEEGRPQAIRELLALCEEANAQVSEPTSAATSNLAALERKLVGSGLAQRLGFREGPLKLEIDHPSPTCETHTYVCFDPDGGSATLPFMRFEGRAVRVNKTPSDVQQRAYEHIGAVMRRWIRMLRRKLGEREVPAEPVRGAVARSPLTENAKRIARCLVKLREGVGLPRKELSRKSGVPPGSVGRALTELKSWSVRRGPKGAGYSIADSEIRVLLEHAIAT